MSIRNWQSNASSLRTSRVGVPAFISIEKKPSTSLMPRLAATMVGTLLGATINSAMPGGVWTVVLGVLATAVFMFVGGVVSFVGIRNPRTATAPETTASSPA